MMTPKEKAKELYNTYYRHLTDVLNNREAEEFAMVCALICVDEQLNAMIELNTNKSLEKFNYFQDVKEEINKL